MAIVEATDFTENALYGIALTSQVEFELPAFIDVIEKGYKLGEKVIRYPRVVVGQ